MSLILSSKIIFFIHLRYGQKLLEVELSSHMHGLFFISAELSYHLEGHGYELVSSVY